MSATIAQDGGPRQLPPGGRVPGYQGFIPGSQHVYGVRYYESTIKSQEITQRILKDNGTHPFHLPDLVESVRPQYSRGDTPSKVTIEVAQATMPPLVQPANEGKIPGYGGYVPGMKNHVYGHRYTKATSHANQQTKEMATNSEGRSSSAGRGMRVQGSQQNQLSAQHDTMEAQHTMKKNTKGFRRSKEDQYSVSTGHPPGYQGYIPSLRNQVIGTRYSVSTEKANKCFELSQKGEKVVHAEKSNPELTNESRPHNNNENRPHHMPPIRKDRAILGFAGYVPALNNHVIGVRQKAAFDLAAEMSSSPSTMTPGPGMVRTSSVMRSEGCIPGFAGFVPGSRDVHGARYTAATAQGAKAARQHKATAQLNNKVRAAWAN